MIPILSTEDKNFRVCTSTSCSLDGGTGDGDNCAAICNYLLFLQVLKRERVLQFFIRFSYRNSNLCINSVVDITEMRYFYLIRLVCVKIILFIRKDRFDFVV